MIQTAKVISTDKDTAEVMVERSSMCEGCHSKECESECSMYKIFGGKKSFTAKAYNTTGAAVGDTVIVETPDKAVNLSVFFVFILPLIIAFAFYAVIRIFLSEALSIALAFASFVLYFAVLAVTERTRKNAALNLRIVSVVKANESENNIKE